MNKKLYVLSIVLILISIFVGVYFYSVLPSTIVTHWNAQGNPNGTMGKFWGIFLFPIISAGILIFFSVIPFIDPLKKNYSKFEFYYWTLPVAIAFFLLIIELQVILWNIGLKSEFSLLLPVGLGILFFYLGVICKNSKRNWFVGIRTPWSMSSDEVWNKTNKLGGILFQISGVISLFGILFENYAILIALVPVGISAVVSVIYSLVVYVNKNKN